MRGLKLLKRGKKMKIKEDWRMKVRVSVGKIRTNELKEEMDMFVL